MPRPRYSRTANWLPPWRSRSWSGAVPIGAGSTKCRSMPSPLVCNWPGRSPSRLTPRPWFVPFGNQRFKDLFLELLALTDAGPRLDRGFLSTERVTHGGFGARFFDRLGLADGAAVPEELRAHVAAGLQHAVEDAVIRMAGEGENL